jgi:hypothetical protein
MFRAINWLPASVLVLAMSVAPAESGMGAALRGIELPDPIKVQIRSFDYTRENYL